MDKKEIILVQNQSSSLRIFLKHLKRKKFSVRIASSLNNLIELAKEKRPDILILSAKLIPEELRSFLSYLRSLIPNGELIVTHVENFELSYAIYDVFPNAQTFRSQIKFALPKELIEYFEDVEGIRVQSVLFGGLIF